MKTYETTYIFSSKETSEKVQALSKEIENLIKEKEGVVLSSSKSDFQTLAYPIKKESSGYFATLTFQITEDKIKDIRSKWDNDKRILRHLITVKKPMKEIKKSRIRKLFTTSPFKANPESIFTKHAEDKKNLEKVSMAEIEKKLEEI